MQFPLIAIAYIRTKPDNDLHYEEKRVNNELELASFQSKFSHMQIKYEPVPQEGAHDKPSEKDKGLDGIYGKIL